MHLGRFMHFSQKVVRVTLRTMVVWDLRPFQDLRHLRLRYWRTMLVRDMRTFQELDMKS